MSLRWTVSDPPCTAANDIVEITSVPNPTTANAGPDQTVCGTTATLAGNTPAVGAGQWTVITGTGTITAPNSPTSGITGLSGGTTVTLRWTISNAPCDASSDDIVITVKAGSLSADAGPDQDVCTTTATLAGNTPGGTATGLWTVVSGLSLIHI